MKKRMRERIDLKKVTALAVFINALQIAAVLAMAAYILAARLYRTPLELAALTAVAVVVAWGAIVDIRDARIARRAGEESDMLEEAFGQLEELNLTLRKQRHDFLNHLQVVFGLIELDQKDEAREYVQRIYGDIQKVGRSMKTALPAVNALLAAKMADCEQRGVQAEFDISSDWRGMPVPAWELCRVLGNLIDNALDALEGQSGARLRLRMGETLTSYTFSVEDNGPGIPEGAAESVFQAGYTTKSNGHGMGLAIVREILAESGGEIRVQSRPGETVFSGSIPRETASAPAAD